MHIFEHQADKEITSDLRDASASRHNGGPTEGPNYAPQYGSAVMARGVAGSYQWVPLMPRDASLSDSCTTDRCYISSLV